MNTSTLHPPVRTFELPPSRSAVPRIRRRLAGILSEWGLPADGDLIYALGLIATELVTNAVTHAGMFTPSIRVTLGISDGGMLRLGIRDNHSTCPRRITASHDATCGRGTAIVDLLLRERGGRLTTEPHPGGKTVWAELPDTFR
ncbi:ATP-binding protein [Embleya sp. NBC_00888]|uniref:ATP-binding protein n=1 Tax=Embleya sp. NBC_00888 TaxID=2975960 RepID=UPI0038669869|nr:ATP-binding protein [Embleya sp. NBC_00888]